MTNPPTPRNSILLFGRPINTFVALGGLGCLLLCLCLCFVVVMPLFSDIYSIIRATRTPASQNLAPVPATQVQVESILPTLTPIPTSTRVLASSSSSTLPTPTERLIAIPTAAAIKTATRTIVPPAIVNSQCPQGCVTPPDGCAIKGNINDGQKIYHVPGGASYTQTKIDPSQGERWFCTEDEARANGWRRAQN